MSDDRIIIRRGGPLSGEITVPGAKNSVLKLMAATLLADGEYTLTNVPGIADVGTMADLLAGVGVTTSFGPDGTITMVNGGNLTPVAPYELVEKIRASINVLTRMRYCDVRGRIAFGEKGAPGTQQAGLYPWYEVPGGLKRDTRIVCGHWSTLGRFAGLGIYAIDTGCVWGGSLTALRLDAEDPYVVSIKSDRAPPPGRDMD